MTTGQEILDGDILPLVFSSLDTVFPEFGWKRTRGGWVATNGRFTRERLAARPDRVVAKMPAGFLVYGDRSYHWLEYLSGGTFPRGPEWWTTVGQLGARVGVSLPAPSASSPRARALEALASALTETDGVRAYLAARRSGAPQGLLGALPAEPVEILEKAGLSREEIGAARIVRDTRWRDRVCCMWRDELGRLSSMWGRATGGEEPRYLVLSGGAPPLFGADLAFAAARRSKEPHGVVVVEGMFDVLSLRASGSDEVVAVGRAGLSAEALKALEAVGEATLLLDSDTAGAAGTLRALEEWARQLSPVRLWVACVTGAKDPDELVRERGIGAMREVLRARRSAASAYVETLLNDAHTEADVLTAARRALPFLSSVAVCHPLEAAAATELFAKRGVNRATMRLLTKQVDVEGLRQLRESLARRLADVDARLAEVGGPDGAHGTKPC